MKNVKRNINIGNKIQKTNRNQMNNTNNKHSNYHKEGAQKQINKKNINTKRKLPEQKSNSFYIKMRLP